MDVRANISEDFHAQRSTERRFRWREENRSQEDKIGSTRLSFLCFTQGMTGNAQKSFGAYEATGHDCWKASLAQMGPVGSNSQGDIDPIINQQEASGGTNNTKESFGHIRELPDREILLSQLKDSGPAR